MKTFSANELNKNPQPVFRAADRDGKVRINHQQYGDKIFVLSSVERGKSMDDAAKTSSPHPKKE